MSIRSGLAAVVCWLALGSGTLALPAVHDEALLPESTITLAAEHCDCVTGYGHAGGVVCTGWSCQEMPRSDNLKPVKGRRDCPKTRLLYCDGPSCKLVCAPGTYKK